MTYETANLVLEHLKRFQSQMNRFEERLDTVQQDLRAMKRHMSAFMASEAAQDEGIAGVAVRLDGIGRRLEPRD